MDPLKELILESELWLMRRILHYAKSHAYLKYTSTLLEAWRISIASLSATLVEAIERGRAAPEFGPDDDYSQDPIAAFGIEEGRRHRGRGLTLGMYLSLFKYYRQSYLDLISQGEFDAQQLARYRYFVDRCFDRIELGMTVAWSNSGEEERLHELQVTNRYLANEKNKYLTIFESLHDPVILLDREGRVSNMNHAAAALFLGATHPGDIYYGCCGDGPFPHGLDWLGALLSRFVAAGRSRLEVEQALATTSGSRHFLIKLEQMLDVSEKFSGVVVLLNDITARKQAEERLHARTAELSTLYDVTSMITAPATLDTVLERALERVLATVRGLGGTIRLLDEQSGELRLVAEKLDPALWNTCLFNSGALAAWVVANDEPLVISDPAGDPRVPLDVYNDHTVIAMPLRAGGRIQGVLSVFRRIDHAFEKSEVSLLSSVADGMALAVENNRRSRLAAVMEERERLARELHDSVTQSLYSLTLFGEWSAGLLDAGETAMAQQKLQRIADIARQALKEMRLMVYELRSSELEHDGLRGALEMRLTAVEERAGVRTGLQFDPAVHLSEVEEEELYHIAQEALNNALKHAAAQEVRVEVSSLEGVTRLVVTDDGVGFNYAAAASSGGMGLATMRSRAARLGGSLHVKAAPGQGCTISVELREPCGEQAIVERFVHAR
ncbi:MAG: GAF domain-containing protein [Caldilineaceae bacterium]|nr:GAF domain-containing protein [Caldilineaceae bacterium]